MSELVTNSTKPTDATARRCDARNTGGAGAAPATPGAEAGAKESGFRPDIQGLRAIAVSIVVIYHLHPSLLPGGFAGVDVFFVISGYLITGHLWRGYRKTGSVSLVDFWGRRARRLVPAAALVLLVTWLVARVVEPVTELPDIAEQIRASALYYQNWQLAGNAVNYLQAEGPATPVQHFWSLSVEEQFYLVWPLLFAVAALVGIAITRAHRGRRRPPANGRRAALVTVALLTTALVACSLAYSVYDTRTNPAAAYFVTTTRMWELGIGGLLAMVPDRLSPLLGGHSWRSVSVALAAVVPVVLVWVYLANPVTWNGQLPRTGYPGAAALASVTSAGLPAEPVLPPVQAATRDMPTYWLENCLAAARTAAEKICTYGDTKNPVRTVALVGDSIAGNWFPALEKIALQRHWKLVTDLKGTCEWTAATLIEKTTGSPYTACQKWGQAVLNDLVTKIKPDVVITSGMSEDGTVGHPQPGQAAFQAIGAGMAQYWTDLEKHGIGVVAIRETPYVLIDVPDCVAQHGRNSPQCAVRRAKAVTTDPPTVLASRDTGGKVKVVDMNSFICGPHLCKPVVGNVLVYLDGRHLTATFGQTLAKYLEPRLLQAAPQLAK